MKKTLKNYMKLQRINVDKKISGVAFEGGGVLGTAYSGAISALMEKEINAKYIAGSSAGSIAAFLYAICEPMNVEAIKEILLSMNYAVFRDNRNALTGLWRLYKKNGWYDTRNLENWLVDTCKKLGVDSNITFGQLMYKHSKYLIITSYSMEKSQTIYMTPESHPNVRVIDACVRSSTIPLFFAMNGPYLDGGLEDNYPIEKLREICGKHVKDPTVIGLKFKRDKKCNTNCECDNVVELSLHVFHLLMENAFRVHLSEKDYESTITIDVEDISSIDFGINWQTKKGLVDAGYKATIKYLDTFLDI